MDEGTRGSFPIDSAGVSAKAVAKEAAKAVAKEAGASTEAVAKEAGASVQAVRKRLVRPRRSGW